MRLCRALGLGMSAVVLMNGCTALREVKRGDYAALPERRDVVVDTRDGQHIEFESARFGPDTLTGYQRREGAGEFVEYDGLPIALDDVASIRARRVDWTRTYALIGVAVVGGVAWLISASPKQDNGSGDGGPVKPPPTLSTR